MFSIQIRNLSIFALLIETTYHGLIQSPDQNSLLTIKPNIIGKV